MISNTFTPEEHPFLRGLPPLAGLSNKVYANGSVPLQRVATIAIIGTRRPTMYGSRVAFDFAERLARRGVIIVSGLAYGIDTAAHKGALAASGTTIAVMAHGLDTVYPSGNQQLAADIVEKGGALISPYEPGTPVHKFRFLERNQWVAGLADAVLVIEAEERSGTKATVRYALDMGKEVFAVPGPITSSQSSGPNRLIAEGAHPALTPEDILEVIAPQLLRQETITEHNDPIARQILKALTIEPLPTNSLLHALGLEIGQIFTALTLLEIEEKVICQEGTWHIA